MADDLRLKVSQADYQQKMQVLQSKMAELETIYGEYSRLKMQANRVLGDGDTNLQQLMDAVQKNMDAVGKQCKGTTYLRNPGYNGTDGGTGGKPAKRGGKPP